MKSYNSKQNLANELYQAFLDARQHKLATSNEFDFELNAFENLARLHGDILSREYRPSRGIAFVTRRPVLREIFAAPFRDRIVHHYIINHVEPWWDNRFIYDSYSCRKGKGTDFGIQRLYTMERRVSDNFHIPTVVIKYDLQGYFTSIVRRLLYERVHWGLEQQFPAAKRNPSDSFLFHTLDFLWQQIIFDDPTENVTIKGCKNDWRNLPSRKSLFNQKQGIGIVIGNLTSQVASNIYLDQLDRFVVHTLGYKNYGRYVDDFFFVLPANQVAEFRRCVEPIIEDFINGLGLTLHPNKRAVYPIEKGVPFLGVNIYPYHIAPGPRVISHYRQDLRLFMSGRKDIDSIISYMGRLQHLDSQHLQRDLWAEVGLDYKLDSHGGPNSRFYTDGI